MRVFFILLFFSLSINALDRLKLRCKLFGIPDSYDQYGHHLKKTKSYPFRSLVLDLTISLNPQRNTKYPYKAKLMLNGFLPIINKKVNRKNLFYIGQVLNSDEISLENKSHYGLSPKAKNLIFQIKNNDSLSEIRHFDLIYDPVRKVPVWGLIEMIDNKNDLGYYNVECLK